MTNEFSLGALPQSSVLVVYSDRHEIELAPEYQRISDIWTREKRQLLIDSLINGFDVPKLYFHEFSPYKKQDATEYRYAIIDGKQRLQTIWDFIDNKLVLADDFKYLRDDNVDLRGLTYKGLGTDHPKIKAKFDATTLPIVTIRTEDIDMIEDMFCRLNEAMPLNAPEKRNAFGGPLPAIIRSIASNAFFRRNVPFPDKRYRHRDMAAKFLLLEYASGVVNTKKVDLDAFVKNVKIWRSQNKKSASPVVVARLKTNTEKTMAHMAKIFTLNDPLLRQVGMITLYFHLFRFIKNHEVGKVTREMLIKFEKARDKNRQLVEGTSETNTEVNSSLIAFDQHSQTPNDAYAIRDRLEILLKYFKKHFKVEYKASILQSAI